MIDEILTLAREGDAATEPEFVPLADVAAECWRNVETDEASLSVQTDLTIRADRCQLQQLLENVFRNAVAHGSTSPPSHAQEDAAGRQPSGEPAVADAPPDAVEHGARRASGRDTPGDAVEQSSTSPPSHAQEDAPEHGDPDVTVTVGDTDDGFYVADDGPGIPEADRENVFEAGRSTAPGGTGLGLRIVEQIADGHDWAVDVDESEDGGARIVLSGVETRP
jgi:signal transduction histidine kinase